MADGGTTTATAEEISAAKATWRYLRVAIVLMVFGLFVAISIEVVKADCFQTSISAYYYTPVRGFFVGALMAIGVCLVSIKGNTPGEDVFLNLAGGLAPVVALVPTRDPSRCASVPESGAAANAVNNIWALLAVTIVGLVLAQFLVRRSGTSLTERAPSSSGWLAAALVLLVGFGLFVFRREFFLDWAHLAAAVLMFVFIFLVVATDARDYSPGGPSRQLRNRYGTIAALMVAATLLSLAAWGAGWRYSVFAIEAALILLFAVFWVLQSIELWNKGLR